MQVKYWGVATPATPAALTPLRLLSTTVPSTSKVVMVSWVKGRVERDRRTRPTAVRTFPRNAVCNL